jgi:DNA-binding MarR family transcriptional regulator
VSVPDGFNELIHAPIRLQICAMLSATQTIEFATLRDGLDVSDSVLSKHIRALDEAGYLSIHRALCASRLHMSLALTAAGREQYESHMQALLAIVGGSSPYTMIDDQRTAAVRSDAAAVS